MKTISLVIFLVFGKFIFANDTLYICQSKYTYLTDSIFSLNAIMFKFKKDNKVSIKYIKLDSNYTYNSSLRAFKKSMEVFDSFFMNGNPYCIFMDKKGRKIEEGIWHFEGGWQGAYISYYKNGNVRSKGEYNNGYKSGVWKYFDQNGIFLEDVIW